MTAPLSRDQRIVRDYLAGEATQAELAQRYGISQARVSAIIRKEGSHPDWRSRISKALHRHHHDRIAATFHSHHLA